jgi:anti-sigma factor RsiW
MEKPMNCVSIQERLSAFFDGELPAEELKEIEAHLKTCTACQGALEGLRRVGEALDRQLVPGMPEGLLGRIMEKAHAGSPSPSGSLAWVHLRWWTQLSVGMRLAAAAVLLLGSLAGGGMALTLTRDADSSYEAPAEPTNDRISLQEVDSFLVTTPGVFVQTYISLLSPPTESVSGRNKQ